MSPSPFPFGIPHPDPRVWWIICACGQVIKHLRVMRPIVYIGPRAKLFILNCLYENPGNSEDIWPHLVVQLPFIHESEGAWAAAVIHVTSGFGHEVGVPYFAISGACGMCIVSHMNGVDIEQFV